VCRKGYRASVDSYSAFYENDHETGTGLMEFLKARGVRRVFVVGVAYDFCVRYTCEDAAKCGLRCVLVKDATRAVGLPGTEDAAKKCLAEAGVAEVDAGGLGEAAKATAP
jgi:nicotinamidase/pyrazinamidase|tara:strand:- start:45 stop:374 length:330 start_codon:yes stop_codon:yes gene_type:complete